MQRSTKRTRLFAETEKFRVKVAAIAVTVLTLLLPVQDGAVHSRDEVTLTGEFLWKHMNHVGDLDAVFTKTGDGAWGVEFRFVWEGELHVYRGTAEGSLTNGELRGNVVTDNPERPQTFSFAGMFERGRFTGTHTALQAGGGTYPTGTLTLGK
jgi:hypothetical protein